MCAYFQDGDLSCGKNLDKIYSDIRLTNRFDSLNQNINTERRQDENKNEKKSENMHASIFIIGSRNIFKSRRGRNLSKSRRNDTLEDCIINSCYKTVEISANMKAKNRLNIFQTTNSFKILTDNPEDNIESVIKRLKIVTAKKKDLKKCRRCNHKKRKCILHPSSCSALNHTCATCKRVGHFPQSLCCQKRRKSEKHKSKKKSEKKTHSEKVSKKNMKLIRLKIQQLELIKRRKKIIMLAEKCVKNFENDPINPNPQNFINYCRSLTKY